MAQHIFKGKMTDEKGSWLAGGLVIFPLIKDTVPVGKSDTITIDIEIPQRQVFYTIWAGWKSKIFRFEKGNAQDSFVNILVSDTAYYQAFHSIKTCPICNKKNKVIKIVYGMPRPKEVKKAEKQKLRLAGCMFDNSSSLFYCKTDDFEF